LEKYARKMPPMTNPAVEANKGYSQGAKKVALTNKPLSYFSTKVNLEANHRGKNYSSPTQDSTAKKLIPFIQQLFIHDKNS